MVLFEIPDGLDLKDKSVVKNYLVEFGLLKIYYLDGRKQVISNFHEREGTEIGGERYGLSIKLDTIGADDYVKNERRLYSHGCNNWSSFEGVDIDFERFEACMERTGPRNPSVNIRGNRKIVRATYFPLMLIFPIPYGLDLEDESVVKKYSVELGELTIYYVDGREQVISDEVRIAGGCIEDDRYGARIDLEVIDAEEEGHTYSEDDDEETEELFTKASIVIVDGGKIGLKIE
jgi:hypothetical protein